MLHLHVSNFRHFAGKWAWSVRVLIMRFCSFEQPLFPVFREFSAEGKDYEFREFRKSPHDKRAQCGKQDMATWLGDDCHPAGDSAVALIDNAGPVEDSLSG
jgi:hypothetical protein